MAQADSKPTTSRLSSLFRDPLVAAAFRRAERDNGEAFAIVPVRPLTLVGGASVEPMEACND